MEYTILLPDKTKVPITAEEAKRLEVAANEGAVSFKLVRTGEYISLRPFPNILQSERYQPKPKRDWDGLKTADEMLLEANPQKALAYENMRNKFIADKSLPRLTDHEQAQVRAEIQERSNA